MKVKQFSKFVLGAAALLGAASALVGCNGGSEDSDTVYIQFVPSRDANALGKLARSIEPLLQAETKKLGHEYKFDITTGNNYAAVTEALASDQTDFGFLTASGYAQAETESTTKGKIGLLLTSVRDGYQVQLDVGAGKQSEEIRAQQVAAMNGKKPDGGAYSYLGQQTSGAENSVTFYNSICFVLSDAERAKLGKEPLDANKDGKVTIDELAGKKVFTQGQTSGAGYLYPSKFLFDLQKEANQNIWFGADWEKTITDKSQFKTEGMKMVEGTPNAAKGEIQRVNTDGGYDAAFKAVMDGSVDAAWGFMDIRYTQGYNKKDSEYFKKDKLFSSLTSTVCMTAPIYNDTISYRKNLSTEKVEAVREAFKALAKQGSKDEEGTGAYYLYNIYSHTGYQDGDPAAYQSEVEMYQWKVAHGF